MWRVLVVVALAACGRVDFAEQRAVDAGPDAMPDAPRVACTVAQCPSGYTTMSGGCYRLGATQLSWLDSELSCEADGGHLVVEDSVAEHSLVHMIALAGGVPNVWIGWTDLPGPDNVYTWVVPDQGGLLQSNPCVFGATGPTPGDADHCALQGAVDMCVDYQDASCGLLENYVCECDGQLSDPSRY